MCDFRGDLESPPLRLGRAGGQAAVAGLNESITLGQQGWQQDDLLYKTDLEQVFRQSEARNVRLVGYSDVEGRPAFKLGIQAVGDRWYLYCGHLWHRGWTILDVTTPSQPSFVKFLPGPENTWTIQMNVADGKLLTSLERMQPVWGGDPTRPHDETAILWDAADPANPTPLSKIAMGGTGSHRNFWAGGQYLHMAANPAGYSGNIYVAMDVSDATRPREVGRWWIEGQGPGETKNPRDDGLAVHGPPYVVGDRAYVSWGGGGMVILDVSDITRPRFVSRLDVSPPFRGGYGGAGVHSVLPLVDRKIAVVNGESGPERCAEPLNFAGIIDIADEEHPRLMSIFPNPRPSPGLDFTHYCDKGGRFGPHNSHLPHHSPFMQDRDDLLYMTWFNAGLRIYDIGDPRQPEEVACFVPPDPHKQIGIFPKTALVTQTEDVLVDSRGYVYITDKNHGIFILESTLA
jgi:hypothetical protein